MIEIVVRKAAMKDSQQLTDLAYSFIAGGSNLLPLFEKLDRDARKKLGAQIKRKIRGHNSIFVIALRGQKIIGFIEGAIQKRQSYYKQKTIGRVLNFTVEKRFRGKGTGKRLFQKLLEWFKKKKVAYFELHALNDQKGLKRMYEKWGFLAVETIFRKPL